MSVTGFRAPTWLPVLPTEHPIAAAVKALDPELSVVFNTAKQRFQIIDRLSPREPVVMTVMEPTGAFRPLDGRVLETLRRHQPQYRDENIRRTEEAERAREAAWEKRVDDIGLGFGEDLKWAGKAVVPSVAWRDRSAMREEIRKAAR